MTTRVKYSKTWTSGAGTVVRMYRLNFFGAAIGRSIERAPIAIALARDVTGPYKRRARVVPIQMRAGCRWARVVDVSSLHVASAAAALERLRDDDAVARVVPSIGFTSATAGENIERAFRMIEWQGFVKLVSASISRECKYSGILVVGEAEGREGERWKCALVKHIIR